MTESRRFIYDIKMALEKFIRGKHDDCKHDGLYSNRKREQQADFHMRNWEEEVDYGQTIFQQERTNGNNNGYAGRVSHELIYGEETRIEGVGGEVSPKGITGMGITGDQEFTGFD